jgi:hypothetical protein
MEDLGEGSVEAGLEAAFGLNPPEPPKPAAAPVEAPVEEAAPEDAPEVEAAPEEEATEEVADDLELEIEVDGRVDVIRGQDKIREFVQKGVKAGRVFEETARAREALAAQAQIQQQQFQFQQAVLADISELQAYDQQLEQWSKVDWAAAFDADPFNALKLKEQRDGLREARSAKFEELSRKQQEFQRGHQESLQKALHAEEAALLAKLPEWRNSEKAIQQKQQITQTLSAIGFSKSEIEGVMDHRMLIVAQKAAMWDQLQQGKTEKLKQVRTAPPVMKPGVKAQPNAKAEFTKVRSHIRTLGSKGNHKAQEALAVEMFNKAFK